MTRLKFQLATTLLTALAVVGCNKAPSAPPVAVQTQTSSSSSTPAQPDAPVGQGSIRGKVLFTGAAPVPRAIDNHTSCGPNPKPIFEESIVVNPNATLRNVVVYLKEVQSDAKPSDEVPVIDQVDCHYIPHVIAITAGQKVAFKSSDPTLHNVHMLGANETNFAMATPGQAAPRKFANVDFTRVKCDVHPWMNCWVAVMDGPYFAVTNDKGECEIKNVPAGTYTLNAWHERFELPPQQVIVVADKAADVTFTVKAP